MLYYVTIGARVYRVVLQSGTVTVDDTAYDAAELVTLPGTPVRHLLANGSTATVVAFRHDAVWQMHVNGWGVHAQVIDERTRAIRAMTKQSGTAQGPRPVRAPMPGLILRVDVEPGSPVSAGQGVVIMEAMKMENELRAEGNGVVARILVQPGETVEKGATLIEFEAPADTGAA
jgi:biotin carboxyl carrier protein